MKTTQTHTHMKKHTKKPKQLLPTSLEEQKETANKAGSFPGLQRCIAYNPTMFPWSGEH